MLNYLRNPEIIHKFRMDVQKIVIIGFSMGGFLSLISAIEDPSINAIASIAGVNFGHWATIVRNQETGSVINDLLKEDLLPLNGTTSEQNNR